MFCREKTTSSACVIISLLYLVSIISRETYNLWNPKGWICFPHNHGTSRVYNQLPLKYPHKDALFVGVYALLLGLLLMCALGCLVCCWSWCGFPFVVLPVESWLPPPLINYTYSTSIIRESQYKNSTSHKDSALHPCIVIYIQHITYR